MEEKKPTIEEIIKALEHCKKNEIENTCEYCYTCPASIWDFEEGITQCDVDLLQKASDLIHRLQDENERLTEENEILKGNPPILAGRSLGKTIRAKLLAFDKMKERNDELQKQVDELNTENGKLVTIGNGFALERNNLREELDELKKSGNGVLLTSLYKKQADDHKRGLSVQRSHWEKKVEQAVKDTEKEILQGFDKWLKQAISDSYDKSVKGSYAYEGGRNRAFHEVKELVKRVAESKGVEVE